MSDSIVFGLHAVRMLLERHPKRVSGIWLQRGREDQRTGEIMGLAREQQIKIEHKSVQELDQLAGGERHQGVIAHIVPSSTLGEGALDDILDAAGPKPLVLVLDGVQDPHNLGACMRTADAMGVCAVVVPRERAAGLSPTVRKVAAGAAETVPLVQVVNLSRTLKWLKERGLWTVGADGDAEKSVHDVDLKGPLAIVMGAEGAGLRRLTRENCDVLIKIPMRGTVESLNVSVATGVVLYEAARQRGGS
jgi:23S rRNA (guanosine2251-2'-O)-methyltransferase